ncbi:diguanylate cyclase [Salinicola peritrichatus]|uniref:sensor domain-containing diguanylate cyclase n=1 Tax=Salinicola peritrichatus TaxID=1267424 RepID=UPI000DA139FF|nr:diguanylate cyclase [Salinicola peritrichatus]
MPLASRFALYLALPALLLGTWPDMSPDQRWVLMPLMGLLWFGQLASQHQWIRASRWLLIPTGLLALTIVANFLIAENWITVAAWQHWLDTLPGGWLLYHLRPPILSACMIFGLALNLLLLSRLGLGSPMLLLLILFSGAWLSYRALAPLPVHVTSTVVAPSGVIVALWLLWLSQLLDLLPILRRYWRRILPPLTVGATIALLAMISWQEQRRADDDHLYRLIANDGDRIASLLASETDAHLKAMRRFTSFWDMLGHVPTRSEWEQQAKRYHDDFSYFRNIAFIDFSGTVIRVYPRRGNQALVGINLFDAQPDNRAALERPLVWGIEGKTGIVDFLQGGRGVISYLPVRNSVNGTLLGAVGMVVSIDTLLNSLLLHTDNHAQAVTLSGVDQLYFHYGPVGDLANWRYAQQVPLGADRLTLSVQPSLNRLLELRSRLPEVTLIFGILLAYLLHTVLYIYRRLAHQHRLAKAANDSLRQEMDKRERLQQEMEWMARHDELTQLPNRRQLLRWIDEQSEHLPLTLMICDLDHFKSVNDHFGHLEGDRYLKSLAQRCRAPVEKAGGLFGRYGGEEFVACLPHCDRARAALIADELRLAVYHSDLVLPNGRPVTLSIGISVCENAPVNRDQMFQLADESLYRAKQRGRNRVELATGTP